MGGAIMALRNRNYSMGWVCPICKQVLAPWVEACNAYHGPLIGTTNSVTVVENKLDVSVPEDLEALAKAVAELIRKRGRLEHRGKGSKA
jgi:hypothetical protein